MKYWIFFIVLSLTIGFGNEWAKLNVNFFFDLTQQEHWFQYSDAEKSMVFQRQVDLLNEAYYFQIVRWEFLSNWSNKQWSVLKWMIPITTTTIFFVLEIIFLPKLFSKMKIQRSHVGYYYGMILLLVGFFFLLFKFSAFQEFLTISRKLWVLLQGPSLFIILWIYQLINQNERVRHQ
jgi:hypothetical protein